MKAIAQQRRCDVVPGRIDAGAPEEWSFLFFSRSGQSLIESCFVIAILCLVLFGGVQISQFYMAREVLNHAAACGARARAVGFNDFMVQKTIRVAAIPLAGQLVQPRYTAAPPLVIPAQHYLGVVWDEALQFNGKAPQTDIEKNQIPFYLDAADWGEAAGYLDYQLDYLNRYGWTYYTNEVGRLIFTKAPNIMRSVKLQDLLIGYIDDSVGAPVVTVTVRHDFPLNYALHRALYAFSGIDVMTLTNSVTFEKHYDLYLQ